MRHLERWELPAPFAPAAEDPEDPEDPRHVVFFFPSEALRAPGCQLQPGAEGLEGLKIKVNAFLLERLRPDFDPAVRFYVVDCPEQVRHARHDQKLAAPLPRQPLFI